MVNFYTRSNSFCLNHETNNVHTFRSGNALLWMQYQRGLSEQDCDLCVYDHELLFVSLAMSKANFTCTKCGKQCGNAGALKIHSRTHDRNEQPISSLIRYIKRAPPSEAFH